MDTEYRKKRTQHYLFHLSSQITKYSSLPGFFEVNGINYADCRCAITEASSEDVVAVILIPTPSTCELPWGRDVSLSCTLPELSSSSSQVWTPFPKAVHTASLWTTSLAREPNTEWPHWPVTACPKCLFIGTYRNPHRDMTARLDRRQQVSEIVHWKIYEVVFHMKNLLYALIPFSSDTLSCKPQLFHITNNTCHGFSDSGLRGTFHFTRVCSFWYIQIKIFHFIF